MTIQNIGWHKITNASVDEAVVDDMLRGERVNILYSDPPWGDGNLKYWVTMNKKMSGREFTPIPYSVLVERFRGLISNYVDGHVIIETGKAWLGETVNMLRPVVHNIDVYTLQYRSGSRMLECVMISGVTNPSYPKMSFNPTGMHGYEVPKQSIASIATPGGIVLDPCCGMGYTARAAVSAGMQFRGNEFNPVRLAKTVKFLERSVGKTFAG